MKAEKFVLPICIEVSPYSPVRNLLISDVAKQKISKAVENVSTEKLPKGVKAVKIYGVTSPKKKGYNKDQRFTAYCSYSDGQFERSSWVLLICYRKLRGWYVVVVPISS